MSNEAVPIKKSKVQTEISVPPPSMPKWGIDLVRFVGLNLSRLLFGLKYHGKENIPSERALPSGLLVCANHQTYLDPFWICFPIKRTLRFMTWDAATRWFIVGNFIRALGSFPVNLERGGKEALKMSLGWLKTGGTLVVFPEGGREHSDGQLLEFKNGAVRIALQAGVPILPVTIKGANRVWSQDMKTPRLARVEVFYHPLLKLPPVPEGSDIKTHSEEITRRLAEIIGSKL
jgi:1-acyl-sn-glycerol-3-phosphate acyltransferase